MPRLLTCACLVLLTANVVEAQNYAIRLEPPEHVGDRYSLSVSGTRLQRSSISGERQVVQDATDEYQVNLNGLMEVLEVDHRGKAVRQRITIDKFTKSQKGLETELLKSGSVVYSDGTQLKSSKISLMGGVLEEAVREALELVVTTHQPNSPTDDDIFGTADEKGIGESWSINRQMAAEDLGNNGFSVSAENLAGKVGLIGKDAVAGVDCLNIAGTFNADRVRPTSFPSGVTIERGVMLGSFGGCFPFAEAKLPNKQDMDMTIQVRANGAAGTPMEGMTVDLTFQAKVEMLSTKP